MPWLKSGDNAATYPKVMQIAGFKGVDPETIVNEVFGWLTRCMLQGAAHTTDYQLDVGTAYMIGGPRTEALVTLCKKARLLTEEKVDGVKVYMLIADPEFMHMRLKAEIDAERQRQRDNSNPALTVPVTLRDGDNCRYCGVLTQWKGMTSARTRTIDHREGLTVPATIDNVVVACNGCNSARQMNPNWDDDHPLRPPPAMPLYGRWAAKHLTENGYPTEQNVGPRHERPAPAPGADPAPTGVRPATAAAGDDTAHGAAAEAPAESTSDSVPSPIRTGLLGSGRVGSGSGSYPPTSPGDSSPPGRARRRGRRGRSGRPSQTSRKEP